MTWWSQPGARGWRCAPAPDVLAFHRSLPEYAPTPLVSLPVLASALGVGRLFVKDESSRFGLPAFKVLGASYAMHKAVTGPVSHVVTATDGNHGRAVAWMARRMGLACRVLVPAPAAASAPLIAAEGADVRVVPVGYDEAVRMAAAEDGLLVQDTAWPGYEQIPQWIVDGYSTMLREIDAIPDLVPDLVVVPMGVGSLTQAVITHYRSGTVRPALLGVEAEVAAGVQASLRAGRLVDVSTTDTVMAGLNCGTTSSLAWPYLRDGLDAAVTVTDAQSLAASDELDELGVSSGPCGAATLAAARAALAGHRAELGLSRSSTVVLLSTEARRQQGPV
ncbi:pyridoxal-phosphate dependent enzyme [Labedaea rhizosphaerae]|uniref:Diaminopropionate ammonia-lyase n=1 Tax=Labedaea rhizosphaerae TaxID=598644 RepID=A0A4R6S370_LABRH|nr:pyridoxal-phosphate dependent enzyme [Labedaea rhizosphaerae]TDP94060.1 diaminopropionate ammonia-lyase [Labedaea rhizosphaerae]